jgi:hypothetical protein
MRNYEKDFNERPRRTSMNWGLSALLVFGVVMAGGFLLNIAFQPLRAIQQTVTAENMIYNYEWFKQQYADIQANDAQQAAFQDQLSTTTRPAEQERLRGVIAGLQSKRATMVATYNARAQMITRDIFRADAPKTVQ